MDTDGAWRYRELVCPGCAQIPTEASKELLPHLIRFLGSESNVVHSYASHAIERLLVLKDGPQFRLSEAEVASFAQPLLGALFNALKMPESQVRN